MVLLVGIGGASSSGKTTLAKLLHGVSPRSRLIHQDDYYKTDSDIPLTNGVLNWDIPEALDFDRFVQDVEGLRTASFVADEKELDTTHPELTGLFKDEVIYVDGFMLFHDPRIINLFDVKIFIKASYDTLKTRRSARGYDTIESYWVDPPGYFDDIVYPAYAESHRHLFLEDVEGDLDQGKVKDLGVIVIQNDDAFQQVVDTVTEKLTKLL